jgi:hypothetical protein
VTPAVTFVAVLEIQEILSIVEDVQARVGMLEQAPTPIAVMTIPLMSATSTDGCITISR